MQVTLIPGHYVAAVSGGVDSTALLHLLQNQSGIKLTVAHFDHGIRDDSSDDRRHVQRLAKKYDAPFVYHEGNLGAGASEAVARSARYDFLHKVRASSGARAIVTAHHQDDVLETAIINLLRGTGRKGLSSLGSSTDVVRPLVGFTKQELVDYARAHNLQWREDSTNENTDYLRNYVRKNILPKFDSTQRAKLLSIIRRAEHRNPKIDCMLTTILHTQPSPDALSRPDFIMLPHVVSKEVLAAWLRSHGIRDFDTKLLERVVTGAKTLNPGKQADLTRTHILEVGDEILALASRDR